jgi:hypothetical protein
MINKKVFEAVMGFEVEELEQNINTIRYFPKSHPRPKSFNSKVDLISINIYEFAHNAKAWMLNNGYFSITMFRADELFSCDIGPTASEIWDRWEECFIEETENEAIFKACEFILNEQGIKNDQ